MATNDDVARPAARAGAPSPARSLLHALLRCAASTPAAEADASRDLGPVRAEHEAQLQQVFEAGQAPLLFRAARENRIAIPPAWRSRLEAAEWCARVRYGSLVDAAAEVVDVCNGQQIPVTLLKGISTSEQYYAAPHERAMKDIDVLIPRDAFEIVEEQLLRRGYRRCEFAFDEHAYHGAPLFHDGRQVCVEIHFALFPPNDPLRRDALFNASHIETASLESTFHGLPVRRLSNELQLVYIASYWLRDLTQNRPHPSFVPPLFDAVYLLKAAGRTLDCRRLLRSLDNELAAASLYVLLSYLDRLNFAGWVGEFLPDVASRQGIVGRVDLMLIHALLDAYLIGGGAGAVGNWRRTLVLRTLATLLTPGQKAKLLRVPWNVAFPPLEPDRYSFAFHRNRLARMLGVRASEPE